MNVPFPASVPYPVSKGRIASRLVILPVLLCIWLLIYATFSPPDNSGVSQGGATPILPPAVLSMIKLVSRVAAIALIGFSLAAVWHHPKRPYAIRALLPLILFAMFGLLSTIWSPLKSVSLSQAVTFALLIMLATYIGTVWTSDRDTERILCHVGIALAALSLLLVALRFGLPGVRSLTRESNGILHSTNACASAGLGMTLTMAARVLWNSPWSRWWPLLVAIHASAMLLGGNRLSMIVTAGVAMGVLGLVAAWGRLAIAAFAISIAGTAYLLMDPRLALVDEIGRAAGVYAKQGQSSSELGSFSGRKEMWDKMWDSYLDSPLLGHGYFVTSRSGVIEVWYNSGNWTAHNFYLQVLTTTGLVGLILMLGGLFYLLISMARGASWFDGSRSTVGLVAIVFVWIFGWGLLNESFVGPLQPESLVFAVTIGVAAGVAASASAQADELRASSRLLASEAESL